MNLLTCFRRAFTLLLLVSVVGCATPYVPVIDKSPNRKIPPERVVRTGDSLYSIAWEFGLDFESIASWNGIRKPYLIKPGQRLRLRPPASATSQVAIKPAVSQKKTPTKSTKPVASKAPSAAAQVGNNPAPSRWNWPAKGKLVGRYSPAKGVNGIQIAGASGSAVLATAAGQVVYTGDGLRGYGNLIIVKHNNDFLSAYAHNRAILVKEGQAVKSRQKIAEMGNTGADRTQLHFEIRQDGKPIDPLKFLK